MEILLLAIKNIDLLPEGLLETLYMTLVSAVFAYAVGLPSASCSPSRERTASPKIRL